MGQLTKKGRRQLMGTTVGIQGPLLTRLFSAVESIPIQPGSRTCYILNQRAIVNDGVGLAVDGTCLPVKIFYGHVSWLIGAGVDSIFLPRLISVAPRSTYVQVHGTTGYDSTLFPTELDLLLQ